MNIKQSDLAKAAGVSLATLNNIERGIGDPRASTIQAIERALAQAGVEVEDDGVRQSVVLVRYDRPGAHDTYFASQRALEYLAAGSLLKATSITVFGRHDGPAYSSAREPRVGFLIEGTGRSVLLDQAAFSVASSPRVAEIAGILLAGVTRLGDQVYYIDHLVEDTTALPLEQAVRLLTALRKQPLRHLRAFFDLLTPDWNLRIKPLAEREGHPLRVLANLMESRQRSEEDYEIPDLFEADFAAGDPVLRNPREPAGG